jgi:outer membrane protein TolC
VIGWVLKGLFCLWLMTGLLLQANAQGPTTDTFLTLQQEKEIQHLILTALEDGDYGARTYLKGKNAIFLTLDDALRQAVERNLLIQLQKQDRLIADSLLTQRQAAFDPLFNITGTYTHSKTFDRNDFVFRERGTNFVIDGRTLNPDGSINDEGNVGDQFTTPPGEEGLQVPVTDAFGNFVCVTVSGELVNPEQCALETERFGAVEFASRRTNALEAWNFSLGAAQLFPWGSSLEVQFQSTRRLKTFFSLDDLGLIQPLSETDPIGQGSRFPWTSELFAAFATALPLSKDFGPYGSAPNVNVMLAQVGRRQADWTIKAAINEALRDVDNTYWELVRSLLQLQIAEQQRETLQALAKSSERLFKEQQITAYDKAQTDTDLANIENRLEILWNSVLDNTHRLEELLDYESSNRPILPSRYTAALRKPVVFDQEQMFATAQRVRPELNISRLELESSTILLKRSRVQTRPDLAFVVSINFGQSDRVLGYESWQDSVSNVFDPDQRDYFVGLVFRIPLGNRAVKSRLAQAQLQFKQAQAQLQQTENQVIQELNLVMTDAYSTYAQIAQTKAALEFSQIAYDRAIRLRNEGLISEFELLQRLDDLLIARAFYTDALIDHRKTQAQLLAAEGVLADRYLGATP